MHWLSPPQVRRLRLRHGWAVPSLPRAALLPHCWCSPLLLCVPAPLPATSYRQKSACGHDVPLCWSYGNCCRQLVSSVALRVHGCASKGTALPVPGLTPPKSTSVSALFHPLSVSHQLSNASFRGSCPLTSKVATGLGAGFAQVKFSIVFPSASVTVSQKSSQQDLW